MGAIADPQLTLFSGQTSIGTNNNWGGTAALSAAFTAVGAFALPAAASAQSSPTFPEEMDDDIANGEAQMVDWLSRFYFGPLTGFSLPAPMFTVIAATGFFGNPALHGRPRCFASRRRGQGAILREARTRADEREAGGRCALAHHT